MKKLPGNYRFSMLLEQASILLGIVFQTSSYKKMAKYSPWHHTWESSLFLTNIRVSQKSFIVEVQRVSYIFPCYQVQKSPTTFFQKERICLGGSSRCLKLSGPLIRSKKLETPGWRNLQNMSEPPEFFQRLCRPSGMEKCIPSI